MGEGIKIMVQAFKESVIKVNLIRTDYKRKKSIYKDPLHFRLSQKCKSEVPHPTDQKRHPQKVYKHQKTGRGLGKRECS